MGIKITEDLLGGSKSKPQVKASKRRKATPAAPKTVEKPEIPDFEEIEAPKKVAKKTTRKAATKGATKRKSRVKVTSNLAAVMDRFKQKFGDEVFRTYEGEVKIDAIPTGSMVVDKIIGVGGIPRGRLTEIFGWESTGKTTLALQIMGNARRMGLRCAYFDYEQAMHPQLAANLGVHFDNQDCILVQPPDFEGGEEIITAVLEEEDAFGLIVIDSVPAMVPRAFHEVKPGETKPIALHARMFGDMLKKLLITIKNTNTAAVFINHARIDISASRSWGPPPIYTPGGSVARFWYSVRLYMQQVSKVKEGGEDSIMGGEKDKVARFNIVRITGEKNKVGYPYLQGEVGLVYGYGIDDAFSIAKIGVNKGIITKGGGGVYSYEDEETSEFSFKVRGEANLRTYLKENPATLMRLASLMELASADNIAPMIEVNTDHRGGGDFVEVQSSGAAASGKVVLVEDAPRTE